MTDLQESQEMVIVPGTQGETDLSDHMTPQEKIEFRAYRLYEERGRIQGFDLDDWLRAEREVLMEEEIH
jgi:hypothetical protein